MLQPSNLGFALPSNPVQVTRYRGVEHSIEQMVKQTLSNRGAMSPKVRFAAEQIVRRVSPKDYLSEILAIRHWVNRHIPYLRDPAHVEWMRDPEALLEEIQKTGVVRADCDEYAQLVASLWLALGNKAEFVTVAFAPAPASHTHVFARAQIPKTAYWVVVDPVAGTREAQMLGRVKQHKFVALD